MMITIKRIKLAECCDIISGSTPKTGVAEFWNGKILWATPKDLSSLKGKYISDTSKKITEQGYESCSTQILPPYSVLLSSRAPIGHIAINTVEMCTNQGFKNLIPHREKVYSDYLYYWLRANKEYLQGLGNGATFKEISKSIVEKIEIPLPSLEEQKCVVRELDAADALRQQRKQAIALLDDYLKAVFLEMFNEQSFEKWLPLNEVSNFIDYRGKTPVKTNSGVQLITAKNVKEGYIDYQPEEFIAEENYLDWMRRGFPKEGDVLFTTEAPLGNTAILPKFDKLAFAQRVIIIQPKSFLVPEFLLFALNSQKVKQDIFSRSTGSTVKGIRSKELVKVKMPVPPIGLQNKFAEIVVKTERLKQTMLIQSDKIEGHFNALMQKTFNE